MLAAHRAQLEHVILPLENEKDLEDVPEEVRRDLVFHPVATLEQALEVALGPAPVANPADGTPSNQRAS